MADKVLEIQPSKERNPMLNLLAVALLSASAAVSPIAGLPHLHPHVPATDKISLTLYNDSTMFRDVKVDGVSYTVHAHTTLDVRGPAGTVVYADSSMGAKKRGEVIVALEPGLDGKRISLR